MDQIALLVGTFGLVSIGGGVLGYVKAKSAASLIAGAAAGAALLACAWGLAQGHPAAELGSALVSGLLGARFLGTWLRRRRFMPDFVMLALSAATLAALAARRWAGGE